ncbi:MAG TPA: hypothetical protein VGP56_08385 [Gaiellaceae bacterium]|jgi:hypothetical protein|nr:hypothetical protein [Gaiellaceae bacterium]
MTITIPKPLAALMGLFLALGVGFMLKEELPALRRYIKFETM